MSHRFSEFDRTDLSLLPLEQRTHDLDTSIIMPLDAIPIDQPALEKVADRVVRAKSNRSSIIWMAGGHVVRSGVQRYIIDLMQQGAVSCLAVNGAVAIHDFELALVGATTESVNRYIHEGQFGLWRETGLINDIVKKAAASEQGLGEAIGRYIMERQLPNRHLSLLGTAHRLGVLVTVHVGIGYDIVAEHPNYSGAAFGETSYRDFLRFTHAVCGLEGGVVMNFGSAVMGPEIYLKALAMARNQAHQQGRVIAHFTSLVCDLMDLPEDVTTEAPKSDHRYYFRPWKTMLARTVRDGGESFYVRLPHNRSIPMLWSAVSRLERRENHV